MAVAISHNKEGQNLFEVIDLLSANRPLYTEPPLLGKWRELWRNIPTYSADAQPTTGAQLRAIYREGSENIPDDNFYSEIGRLISRMMDDDSDLTIISFKLGRERRYYKVPKELEPQALAEIGYREKNAKKTRRLVKPTIPSTEPVRDSLVIRPDYFGVNSMADYHQLASSPDTGAFVSSPIQVPKRARREPGGSSTRKIEVVQQFGRRVPSLAPGERQIFEAIRNQANQGRLGVLTDALSFPRLLLRLHSSLRRVNMAVVVHRGENSELSFGIIDLFATNRPLHVQLPLLGEWSRLWENIPIYSPDTLPIRGVELREMSRFRDQANACINFNTEIERFTRRLAEVDSDWTLLRFKVGREMRYYRVPKEMEPQALIEFRSREKARQARPLTEAAKPVTEPIRKLRSSVRMTKSEGRIFKAISESGTPVPTTALDALHHPHHRVGIPDTMGVLSNLSLKLAANDIGLRRLPISEGAEETGWAMVDLRSPTETFSPNVPPLQIVPAEIFKLVPVYDKEAPPGQSSSIKRLISHLVPKLTDSFFNMRMRGLIKRLEGADSDWAIINLSRNTQEGRYYRVLKQDKDRVLAEIQTAVADSRIAQAPIRPRLVTRRGVYHWGDGPSSRRRASPDAERGASPKNGGGVATPEVAVLNDSPSLPADNGVVGRTRTPLHGIKFRYWSPGQPKEAVDAPKPPPNQPSAPKTETTERLFFQRHQWQTVILTVLELLRSNGKGEISPWMILCRVIPAKQVTEITGYNSSSPELKVFFIEQLEMAAELISSSPSGHIEERIVRELKNLGSSARLGELLSKKFGKKS